MDSKSDLSKHLAQTFAQAQQNQRSIEDACLLWVNGKSTELALSRPLSDDDIQRIKDTFATRYAEINDSPHFDEFFVLDTPKTGAFVTHQGSICTSFAKFVGCTSRINAPIGESTQ